MRYIIGILISCMLLTACAAESSDTNKEQTLENSTNTMNLKQEQLPIESRREKIELNGIQLHSASIIAEGNIYRYHIEYPYWDDYSDELINRINYLIYEAAIPDNDLEFFEYKDYADDIYIDYEVMYMTDNLLSILFSGSFATRGGYADYKKAITIDMENGTIVLLRDIVSFSELQSIVNDLIETENCTVLNDNFNNTEGKEVIKSECLKKFNEETIMLYSDCFYLKENTIGLIGSPYPSLMEYMLVEFNIGKTLQVDR
ncbi:hypothetical protein LJC58_09560 [Lachnospiraceae bacterium OttesenSCG-928-D06]|nr:hypothetical protein [Lachnospiraceae bacterium OttesenSCG-928-D06]